MSAAADKVGAAELRKRIVSHGKSKPSPSGPVYVRCQCAQCRHDLAALAALEPRHV